MHASDGSPGRDISLIPGGQVEIHRFFVIDFCPAAVEVAVAELVHAARRALLCALREEFIRFVHVLGNAVAKDVHRAQRIRRFPVSMVRSAFKTGRCLLLVLLDADSAVEAVPEAQLRFVIPKRSPLQEPGESKLRIIPRETFVHRDTPCVRHRKAQPLLG